MPFDIDVNENEPLFVNARQEVLNQANVAAFDLARRVEALEIVERVTAIAQHWRRP